MASCKTEKNASKRKKRKIKCHHYNVQQIVGILEILIRKSAYTVSVHLMYKTCVQGIQMICLAIKSGIILIIKRT